VKARPRNGDLEIFFWGAFLVFAAWLVLSARALDRPSVEARLKSKSQAVEAVGPPAPAGLVILLATNPGPPLSARTNPQTRPTATGVVLPILLLPTNAAGFLQASTDLRQWTNVKFLQGSAASTTNLLLTGGGRLLVTNWFSNSGPIMFYRVKRVY